MKNLIIGDTMYTLDAAFLKGRADRLNNVCYNNNPYRDERSRDQWNEGHVIQSEYPDMLDAAYAIFIDHASVCLRKFSRARLSMQDCHSRVVQVINGEKSINPALTRKAIDSVGEGVINTGVGST